MRLAQVRARRALESEIRQRDACFLANLQCREAQVHVERKTLGARLVEHGLAAVVIRDLAEAPHELFRAGIRADRIAECDPTAARDLIHHKRIAGFGEHSRLSPREGGVRHCQVRKLQ